MAVPARVAIQTFHQPTNQPTIVGFTICSFSDFPVTVVAPELFHNVLINVRTEIKLILILILRQCSEGGGLKIGIHQGKHQAVEEGIG
jgi:hypothetical protein